MTLRDLLDILPLLFKWFPPLKDLLETILNPHETPIHEEVRKILAGPEVVEVSELLKRLKAKQGHGNP